MNGPSSGGEVRRILANATGTDPDDWHLCLKARYGMAVVFAGLADVEGVGQVVTTPYTCATAVNPILVAGLTPVYADLDPASLSISDPAGLISAATRAIVAQNTLGIIGDRSGLRALADRHHLVLVEDSAHCVARLARGDDGQPLADVSIHSAGIEKVLPIGFGGAVWVNPRLAATHPGFHHALRTRLAALPVPGFATRFRVRIYRGLAGILARLPRSLRPAARRLTIAARLLEPPVAAAERAGRQPAPLASYGFVDRKLLTWLPRLPQMYVLVVECTKSDNREPEEHEQCQLNGQPAFRAR